jgi:hypothetical protein
MYNEKKKKEEFNVEGCLKRCDICRAIKKDKRAYIEMSISAYIQAGDEFK